MKKENDNNSKGNNTSKELKVIEKKHDINKDTFFMKFINIIKKRWLISGTNTLLLIAILIAIVILINMWVNSLELTPIDCTSNKEYTLTQESKDKVKDIENEINIYFVGYADEDEPLILAKQYNKVNEKINVEIIDLNERTDIADKYNIANSVNAIIVESGDRSKILYSDDLYTYDSSYKSIDLTEEKLTSAILNVISENVPKVYFLTNYSDYDLTSKGGMEYLSLYLKDEVLEYSTLDILVTGSIPEDCNTLVILTPSKDFDELTTNEIINYINKGGNILWLNSSYTEKKDLPNVNKILALYGVNPFDKGYIYETDTKKTVLGYASCFVQELGNTDIDKNLSRAILLNPTKINIDEDKLEELNVEKETIITSSDTTYFRSDVSKTSSNTEGDEQGGFEVASILTKKIEEEKADEDENNDEQENSKSEEDEIVSKLIIFGDNNFVTDAQIANNINPMIFLEQNADLALNSIASLTDRKDEIAIRKNRSSGVTFTATDGQKAVIKRIIFAVPIAIIVLGIVVWQKRRRKK